MYTLIVYCSSHGTTAKAVKLLASKISGEIIVADLKEKKEMDTHLDVSLYDNIIIGGSIHAGNIQGKVKQFVKSNLSSLLLKNVGLFLCCMRTGEIATQQFEAAFPEELRKHAVTTSLFGGEFLVSKMNFVEKKIVKKISGVSEDTFMLNEDEIFSFAEKFNKNYEIIHQV
ncbi:flavodoxin domain-containing protein [Bacillaceae bacterium S4-13-58]